MNIFCNKLIQRFIIPNNYTNASLSSRFRRLVQIEIFGYLGTWARKRISAGTHLELVIWTFGPKNELWQVFDSKTWCCLLFRSRSCLRGRRREAIPLANRHHRSLARTIADIGRDGLAISSSDPGHRSLYSSHSQPLHWSQSLFVIINRTYIKWAKSGVPWII